MSTLDIAALRALKPAPLTSQSVRELKEIQRAMALLEQAELRTPWDQREVDLCRATLRSLEASLSPDAASWWWNRTHYEIEAALARWVPALSWHRTRGIWYAVRWMPTRQAYGKRPMRHAHCKTRPLPVYIPRTTAGTHFHL